MEDLLRKNDGEFKNLNITNSEKKREEEVEEVDDDKNQIVKKMKVLTCIIIYKIKNYLN